MAAAPRRPLTLLERGRCVTTIDQPPQSIPSLLEYATEHHGFVRVLKRLALPLAVARVGDTHCLGILCGTRDEAWRRAAEIAAALARRPRLLAQIRDDLAVCVVRIVDDKVVLAWPGVPVGLITLQ